MDEDEAYTTTCTSRSSQLEFRCSQSLVGVVGGLSAKGLLSGP